MVRCRIDGVKHVWTDQGVKMWNIFYTRLDDNTQWVMRSWGRDELDAYKKAMTTLEGASK